MFKLRVMALLLLGACTSTPFKDYEVPTLPEELLNKVVGSIPGGLEAGDMEKVVSNFSPQFLAEGYDPGSWKTVSSAHGIETRKWERTPPEQRGSEVVKLDRTAIRAEWEKYLATYRTVTRGESKPRIMNVREPNASCTYFFDIHGVDASGQFRNDRLWIQFWFKLEGDQWKILAHQTLEGDSVLGDRTRFRDIARENGTAYAHNPSPMFGPDQMERQTFPLVVRGDSGIAAADYDGDGWVDLYFCDGIRNALMRNKGDGTFEDVTKAAGLEEPQKLSRSALFADFDNDGDVDLYVTYEKEPCRFYENAGNGTFRNITDRTGLGYTGYSTSLAAADYNNDGLLDLYMGCYGDFYTQFPTLKEKNGDPNVLFKNLGGLRFQDVTKETGVGDRGWTLACTWGDYDNDGDPDLFVCNDFGENALFRNEKGEWFSDMTVLSGVAVDGFGMSSTFGDFDNDGDLDIYLAGMYSNAGQWIFNREELLPVPNFIKGIRDKVMGMLDYMTDGNRLLRNEGNGKFTEIAKRAGVDYGQFAWCSPWLDYDNDGDLDIYCVNGFWTGPDTEDL